jgi:hypothetical protein
MVVMLLGRLIEVRPLQLENAEDPMLVMVLGRLMDVRPVQPENAEDPIPVTEYEKLAVVVTLLGMVIAPVYSPLLVATSAVVALVTKYLMPLLVNSLAKSFHPVAAA